MDYQGSRPEARYGMPAADQIIFNYYLEIIDQKRTGGVGRSDNFRPDSNT